MRYTDLINNTLDIYMNESIEKALKYLNDNEDKVQGVINEPQLYNYKYSLVAANGDCKSALEIMKEAIVEKEYWYSYEYLMEDEDLQELRDEPDFEPLANICELREKKAKLTTLPMLKIIKSTDGESKKSFMVLHADQENADMTKEYWESVTDNGFDLALAQSSQIQLSQGYVWSDVREGANDLVMLNELLKRELGERKVILGGFSEGCSVIISAVANQLVNIDTIVLVSPWICNIDEVEMNIENFRNKKIYVVCGSEDDDCISSTHEFLNELEKAGIESTFIEIEGLGHEYANDFDEILNEIIDELE